MDRRIILFTFLVAASALLIACGSAPDNANTGNTKPANATTANSNSVNADTSDPTAVKTPTPDPNLVTNNAPTLTPVYKAYCAAVVKKDDAAVRKFFDTATLKHYDEQMKADGVNKLSEYVDPVTNEVCEVANERFKGDKGVARVKTKSYPNGFEVLWVKENGEWKMSNVDPKIGFQ